MAYGESKVYFDGSHYIAIPHTTRPSRKRKQLPEEEITINEQEKKLVENVTNNDGSPSIIEDDIRSMILLPHESSTASVGWKSA